MKPTITLTKKAADHIHAIIERRGKGIGFRISVKTTGCSGFQYVPEIIDTVNPEDTHVKTDYNLDVYIDKNAVDIIRGTELDYVKKDILQEQLMFNNPNVDSECGCGESFNLKEDKKS